MGEADLPDKDWTQHDGRSRPKTKGRKIIVRIRCRTRTDVAEQEPQEPGWWRRWTHDGGPGDIMEWRYP